MKRRKYSTASHIGQAAFCPHSLHLQLNKKTTYSKTTIRKREKGIEDHNQLNVQVKADASFDWVQKIAIALVMLFLVGVLVWLK